MPKARKNLTWACDACKRSKVRCTGETPCARCTKRGTECVYSPQKKRGYPQKRPRKSRTVDQPPQKVQCVSLSTLTEIEHSLNTIIDNEDQIGECLDVYSKYFHSQATLRLYDISVILNPTTELHGFCRIIALLYGAPAVDPSKYPALIEVLFHYASIILSKPINIDILKCLAILIRYLYCVSAAKCEEYRNITVKHFKQYIAYNNEPQEFLELYRIRGALDITSTVETYFCGKEFLDEVQEEYLHILESPDEDVLQKYKQPKQAFEVFYNLFGHAAHRVYYNYSFKLTTKLTSKMTCPPILTEEQKTYVSKSNEIIFSELRDTVGVPKAHPFMKSLYDLIKCSLLESVNKNADSLKIARETVASIKSNVHMANYVPYYIIFIFNGLFKCFLRHSCFHEAREVNELSGQFSLVYPRFQELIVLNNQILDKIKEQKSIDGLFEEPVELHQLLHQKITLQNITVPIPSLLEPKTMCGPPIDYPNIKINL